MTEMVIHFSKDDWILSGVHSTEENRRGIVRENIARKLRGWCQTGDGGKEASKKNSALKKRVLGVL